MPYHLKGFCLIFIVLSAIALFQLFITVENDTWKNLTVTVSTTAQTLLPPHWEDAPSKIEDYPITENIVHIDPWNYIHRLGLYKIILKETSELRDEFGSDNKGNLLWGLPLQFGWQFETGRLKSFPATRNCQDEFCVSYNSWWASMNYYLSVIPFLGAVNSGVIDIKGYQLQLTRSKERPHEYCTCISSCYSYVPYAMAKWSKFFEVMENQYNDPHGKFGSTQQIITFDSLLGLMWQAHTSSLHSVIDEFYPVLQNYSSQEKMFGIGWGHLVDYMAASHFNTNLTNTYMFQQQGLPKRLLSNEDSPPFISDMTKIENVVIFTIQKIYSIDLHTGDAILRIWQRMMCSDEAYTIANELMSAVLLLQPVTIMVDIFKITKQAIFMC
ncbi:protein LEG1 homolog [Ptychodera flava]|uniref:protein LEG1 homolog n=1 Tax=Ptychodera flava TaxID=63121 RepID=UPI00396AA678